MTAKKKKAEPTPDRYDTAYAATPIWCGVVADLGEQWQAEHAETGTPDRDPARTLANLWGSNGGEN